MWYKMDFFSLFLLYIADMILVLLVLLPCKIVTSGYDNHSVY